MNAAPNTLFTGADGKFDAPPDTALVQFNISAQADNAKAAYDQASKQSEQVRQIMRDNGIDPKTAQIGSYSIEPVYDWKTAKRRLIGYRVGTGVTLKLKDFAKIGSLTQQLADSAVSESQSISYTLDNMDEAKNKAVEDAYRRARAAADSLARAEFARSADEIADGGITLLRHTQQILPLDAARPLNLLLLRIRRYLRKRAAHRDRPACDGHESRSGSRPNRGVLPPHGHSHRPRQRII